MKTSHQLISGPDFELITIAQAKDYLRIDGTDQDQVLFTLIIAARKAIENEIGKPIGEQTFELGLSNWPYCNGWDVERGWYGAPRIELSRTPAIELISVKYQKQDLTWITLCDSSTSPVTVDYRILFDETGLPGAVYLRSTYSWPTDTLAEGYPVRVRYTAGITGEPEHLRTIMLLVIAYLYEHRDEDDTEGLRKFVGKIMGLADGDLHLEMR